MFDPELLHSNPEVLKRGCEARGVQVDWPRLVLLDRQRREGRKKLEKLRSDHHRISERIAQDVRTGGPPPVARMESARRLAARVKAERQRTRSIERTFRELARSVPNPPVPGTPAGRTESGNVEVMRDGTWPAFPHPPLDHWALCRQLGLIEEPGGRPTPATGFVTLSGMGARLERALLNWLLDAHTRRFGYVEMAPPQFVRSRSLEGTGQLPVQSEGMYRLTEGDLWLAPSAEPAAMACLADQILASESLPLRRCLGTTACRREAGGYGQRDHGLLRLHQFRQVELLHVCAAPQAEGEFDGLMRVAEALLRELGLPWRRMRRCAGRLSFAAAHCEDLEVWAPAAGAWIKVGSCAGFGDFQARRLNIRHRDHFGAAPRHVHTINGSVLGLPRTLAVLLENRQRPDGSVVLPEVLQPYMGVARIGG